MTTSSFFFLVPAATERHYHVQLLPMGSNISYHTWGTGAELVGNAGNEKTLPAGKATGKEKELVPG